MVAVNHMGIISYEIKDGAFDGKTFIDFISKKLSVHFAANTNDVLVMYNCSFHHRKDVNVLLNPKIQVS